jgi:WYL domain
VSAAAFRFRARVTVHLPAAVVADRLPPAVGATVEAIDDQSCVLTCGADSVESISIYLGLLDADFTVTEPPELVARLQVLAARYQRAVQRC